jgi:hypothetical protein
MTGNVPMPEDDGLNVPATESVMPVPDQTPPGVAALRLNAGLPVQTVGTAAIVGSELDRTLMVVVSAPPQNPGSVTITEAGPGPAIAGSNVPLLLLVIPLPDHTPPLTVEVSVIGPPATQVVEGAVITGDEYGTTVTTEVSDEPQLPLIV